MAALKGIDLEKHYGNPVEDRRKEIERRALEKKYGAEELNRMEFAEFGIEIETDFDYEDHDNTE